jgi:2-C-methyl-D-erythritol 2,4-cyclodiphosphate synthase
MNMRIGFGSDIHRLESGRPLIIGGVAIPGDLGAVGHSDADALTHAVTDAILGAMAAGDIGSHFSDRDERWAGVESFVFLHESVRMMRESGYRISNLDSTVHLERPKLRPHIDQIRTNLAEALGVAIEQVSVKAKTGEGVDAVGESRAIRAEAVVMMRGPEKN